MNVRRVTVLEVEFLEETPEVTTSSRGWGEASVHSVEVRRIGDQLEITDILNKRYRVDREVLRAMLRLK